MSKLAEYSNNFKLNVRGVSRKLGFQELVGHHFNQIVSGLPFNPTMTANEAHIFMKLILVNILEQQSTTKYYVSTRVLAARTLTADRGLMSSITQVCLIYHQFNWKYFSFHATLRPNNFCLARQIVIIFYSNLCVQFYMLKRLNNHFHLKVKKIKLFFAVGGSNRSQNRWRIKPKKKLNGAYGPEVFAGLPQDRTTTWLRLRGRDGCG